MQPERSALSHIVESVADGSGDVDWDALEAELPDEHDRRLVRQLRILARISEVHRTADDEVGSSSAGGEAPGAADELIGATSKVIGRIEPRGMLTVGDQSDPSAPASPEPAPPELAPGAWGPLQLIEKVGEGTFGEVYRAFDTQLQREIAVKLLRVGSSPDKLVERMLREGRVLAKVQHPNVVVVHGAEVREGRVGLSMAFIRGATLEGLLKTHGTFSAREAALIGQDLGRAVAAVHGAGLVHRDIKAQNVMREVGGRVVLMDFGAGQLRDAGAHGVARLTGTPLYLAPEVLNGGDATVQSDIYSLGVLLYHLVTGDFPVRAKALDQLRAAHAERRGVRLHDARPDLPDGFVQTVERAIDPDPVRRFESAGAMLAALRSDHVLRPGRADDVTRASSRLGWLRSGWVGAVPVVAAMVLASVAAWQLSSRGTAVWPRAMGSAAPVTLAVLPFEHDSAVPEYVAEDLRDRVAESLGRTGRIHVVGRASSRALRAAMGAGGTLPSDAKVEYSIRARISGAQPLEVSVRLGRPGQADTWSRSFNGTLGRLPDIIAAETIAEFGLSGGTGTPDASVSASQAEGTTDLLARASHALERGVTEQAMALSLFERAVAIEPRNVRARTGLARAYWEHGCSNGDDARKQAEAALGLNDGAAQAHTVLAEVLFLCDWNWGDARHHYEAAVSANPSDEFARRRYAMFLAARGEGDRALVQMTQARQLDFLSATAATSTATLLQYRGRLEEAESEVRRAIGLDPSLPAAQVVHGRVLAAQGRFIEASRAFARAGVLETSAGSAYIDAEIAATDAAAGRRAEALDAVRRLEALPPTELGPEMIAFVYARLGDRNEAFRWLDTAFETRSERVLWLTVDPRVQSLRGDARFKQLLERLDLGR